MKRAAIATSTLAFALLLALVACPPPTTPPTTPTPTPAASPKVWTPGMWSGHAEKCIARLDEAAAKVEEGDRKTALDLAKDKAYFEEYEGDLEIASKTNLPEEELDGRMRNVVQSREQSFAEIQAAIKKGAPAEKVRSLVGDLAAKIRADAKKLDEQKLPPP